MLAAVIFDCDGVMFDTAKANTAYYNRILRHFGKPEMTPAQFEFVQMHTVNEGISFLFGDDDSIAEATAYRNQMGYEPFYAAMEIEPDLKPLLKTIRPRLKTAIATNRSDTISRVLTVHDLENLFDLVVGSLDVPRPKPFPDSLLKVATNFKIEPNQAIFIGDSILDQQAAQAAGMPFVAYRNRALNATAHIDRLKALLTLLDEKKSFFSA